MEESKNETVKIKGYSVKVFRDWYNKKYNKDITSFGILNLMQEKNFEKIADSFEIEQKLKKRTFF